jgi:hypothetical protein
LEIQDASQLFANAASYTKNNDRKFDGILRVLKRNRAVSLLLISLREFGRIHDVAALTQSKGNIGPGLMRGRLNQRGHEAAAVSINEAETGQRPSISEAITLHVSLKLRIHDNLLANRLDNADEIEEMIDIFKQNEVLWRVIHCDYYKPGPWYKALKRISNELGGQCNVYVYVYIIYRNRSMACFGWLQHAKAVTSERISTSRTSRRNITEYFVIEH